MPTCLPPGLIIAKIQSRGYPDPLRIVGSGGLLRFGFCLLQGGHQHGGKDRNDRNNYQQFDEREALSMVRFHDLFLLDLEWIDTAGRRMD